MKKEKNKDTYSLFSNVCYIWKHMQQIGNRYYIYAGLYLIFLVAIPFAITLLPGFIISLLEANQEVRSILKQVAIILAVILVANLIQNNLKKNILWGQQMMRLVYFQNKFNQKILSCDYISMEGPKNRMNIQAATQALALDSDKGLEVMFHGVIILIANIIGFILYSMIVSTLQLWILLLLLTTALINYFAQMKAREYEFTHMNEFWKNADRFWYLKKDSTEIKKAKDIRLFQLQHWFMKLFDENTKEATSIYGKINYRIMFANQVIRITSMIRDLAVYTFLIYQMINQTLSISEFVIYVGIVYGFGSWLDQIVLTYSNMKKGSIDLSKLRAFLNQLDNNDYDTQLSLSKQPHEIVFEDVSFGYDEHNMIFEHFNLAIHPGEKIALVGINGAGKTTLMKLLCGLYPLNKGRILIDGVDIAHIEKNNYFKEIAIVFQDINEMAYSIGSFVSCSIDNKNLVQQLDQHKEDKVLYKLLKRIDNESNHLNEYNEQKIIMCLKKAGLWDKVASLPNGIHTNLTKMLDKEGIMLSGGEMQKLMLAKALYKNSHILILDEPTAALDPIAESEMYEKYAELCTDKTSVFISHRLSSTKFCDRIIFLKNGRIVESGTHDSLLKEQGEYANMFNVQAHYYQKEVEENEAFN